SAASWKEILDVNLMSYVFCAKAAVPLMRRNTGGAIVNVASVRSVVAGGGNLQYDTTKAAVARLTPARAADPPTERLRCTAGRPGAGGQFLSRAGGPGRFPGAGRLLGRSSGIRLARFDINQPRPVLLSFRVFLEDHRRARDWREGRSVREPRAKALVDRAVGEL